MSRHQLVVDPDIPPDFFDRSTCATCHRVGVPGDVHHHPTDMAPPLARPLSADLAAAARHRDAAILGEREDD